ncbi:hypothetical protein [Lacrimispora sp.]|uniref:hypothetical protein n=1 Tax=Lacrimispora sp. TaxID=2719234 RepID=UPI002FDB33CB
MDIKEFYDKLDQKYREGDPEEVEKFINYVIKNHRPCFSRQRKKSEKSMERAENTIRHVII